MESLWIVRLAVNAVALYAAIYFVPGLQAAVPDNQSWVTYVVLALIFGLVNLFIRPILKLVTCPFYILTLGLFSLIVNTLLFMLTFWIGAQFNITSTISNWVDAFLGAIIVSIVSMLLYAVIPDGKRA